MSSKPLFSSDDAQPGFQPPRPPQWLPRFWRSHRGSVQALAAALALVSALGFFMLPWLLHGMAEARLSLLLQRRVGIERILFNPFALSLELRGLEIRDAQGEKVAGLARLYADVSVWHSLWLRGASLAEVTLSEPYLRVVRSADGRLDWADLVEALAKPEAQPSTAAPRFMLQNISIENGELIFDDRLLGHGHALRGLGLRLPVLSSQPDNPDFAEARLTARLNGAALELTARARPFAIEPDAAFELTLDDLELSHFQAYLSAERPAELTQGKLDLRLRGGLSQPAQQAPLVNAVGQLALKSVELSAQDGQPLLGFERLQIEFGDFDLRERRLAIKKVQLDAPKLNLVRLADGRFNLTSLASRSEQAPANVTRGAAGADFELMIDDIIVHDGQLAFRDQAIPGGFATTLQKLELALHDLSWPSKTPARLALSLQGEGGAALALQARLDPDKLIADGQLRANGWGLGAWQAYYSPWLRGLQLETGMLGLEADFEFAGLGSDAAHKLDLRQLRLENLALRQPSAQPSHPSSPSPFLQLAAIELAGATIRPSERQIRIERLSLLTPQLELLRSADGRFEQFAGLVLPAPGSVTPTQPAAPWRVELTQLQLMQGRLQFEDRSLAQPLKLLADELNFEAGPLTLDPATRTRFTLASRIDRQGQLQSSGELQLEPLEAKATLALQRLNLASAQVLLPDGLALKQGSLSARGELQLARQPDGRLHGGYRGEAALEDLALLDRSNHADLLRWRRLALSGIDAQLSPPAIALEELHLSDFHTQLILDAEGQLNLRTLAAARRSDAAAAKPLSSEAAKPQSTGVLSLPFALRLGKAIFSNGQVQFSDRFIRPNFDADLQKLDGELLGLDSSSNKLARLSISGQLGAGAPMAISGELNPFRRDAYLDIRATVRDYELTSASTYAARYVGYGIDKGKLSAELNYQVRERQLSASNRIRLDQLTFGEQVDSPDALKLPVRLAVALLKNSRGEIELDLPIAGTLDDPQFSLGGLIMQAMMNLLVKTVTAPFRMLAALFGGGETLESVEFSPGSAQLDAVAVNKLAGLARALAERPGLRLEITGQIDPQADAEGLARQGLLNRLRALKEREQGRAASASPLQFDDPDYGLWLEKLYREADIDKPRNLVGLARKLPVAEMEALLLAAYPALPSDFDALSRQRANAVKEWLIGPGQVEAERLYLRASHEADRGEGLNRAAFSLR